MPISEATAAMIAAGIAAGGTAASGGIQAGVNRHSQKRAFKYNQKLAEQANQYNLEQWNRVAAYNSPKAQMERYREAGLNPNLIYGEGASGSTMSLPEGASKPSDISELGQWNVPFADAVMSGLDAYQRARIVAQDLDVKRSVRDYNFVRQLFTETQDELMRPMLQYAQQNAENTLKLQNTLVERQNEELDIAKYRRKAAELMPGMTQTQASILSESLTNLKYDGDVKAFAANLARSGIDPNSDGLDLILQQLFSEVFEKDGNGDYHFTFSNLSLDKAAYAFFNVAVGALKMFLGRRLPFPRSSGSSSGSSTPIYPLSTNSKNTIINYHH